MTDTILRAFPRGVPRVESTVSKPGENVFLHRKFSSDETTNQVIKHLLRLSEKVVELIYGRGSAEFQSTRMQTPGTEGQKPEETVADLGTAPGQVWQGWMARPWDQEEWNREESSKSLSMECGRSYKITYFIQKHWISSSSV